MLDVVLVAGLHIHTQHQSQVRQHVGVIAVRRATGLVRIVAEFGTLLLAIQRLDRGIDVQHPRLVQQRRNRVVKMALQPAQPRRFVDLAEVAAHRVLAQHLAHAKQRRVHPIAAQRRDVGVAPMTRQNRQQHGAKQIALARRIRTSERQWAVRYPAIEQPALLQVLDEERQLAEWRHRRRRVPLHVNPTGVGVGDRRPRLNLRLLTLRVNHQTRRFCPHRGGLRRFGANAQSSNCRI